MVLLFGDVFGILQVPQVWFCSSSVIRVVLGHGSCSCPPPERGLLRIPERDLEWGRESHSWSCLVLCPCPVPPCAAPAGLGTGTCWLWDAVVWAAAAWTAQSRLQPPLTWFLNGRRVPAGLMGQAGSNPSHSQMAAGRGCFSQPRTLLRKNGAVPLAAQERLDAGDRRLGEWKLCTSCPGPFVTALPCLQGPHPAPPAALECSRAPAVGVRADPSLCVTAQRALGGPGAAHRALLSAAMRWVQVPHKPHGAQRTPLSHQAQSFAFTKPL